MSNTITFEQLPSVGRLTFPNESSNTLDFQDKTFGEPLIPFPEAASDGFHPPTAIDGYDLPESPAINDGQGLLVEEDLAIEEPESSIFKPATNGADTNIRVNESEQRERSPKWFRNARKAGAITLALFATASAAPATNASEKFAVASASGIEHPIGFVPQCADGADNDGNGKYDHNSVNTANSDTSCADPNDNWEFPYPSISTREPPCLDGIDNDYDGLVDYPADPECVSADDPYETSYQPEQPIINPPVPKPNYTAAISNCITWMINKEGVEGAGFLQKGSLQVKFDRKGGRGSIVRNGINICSYLTETSGTVKFVQVKNNTTKACVPTARSASKPYPLKAINNTEPMRDYFRLRRPKKSTIAKGQRVVTQVTVKSGPNMSYVNPNDTIPKTREGCVIKSVPRAALANFMTK